MTVLGELGLSSYEEKVYRTLLVTGSVTAAELSDTSGVPKGRIYDVVNGLEARNLIWRQSSDPNRYAAVQPESVVD
ncbi:TrmB family transcriptional regulator, partial [Halococcus sediminicola]|uniref:TrmB family transcriptional regulator n=1 Tax=Halococcus sediminicola TaxID=1264579 RepID=UPI001377A384